MRLLDEPNPNGPRVRTKNVRAQGFSVLLLATSFALADEPPEMEEAERTVAGIMDNSFLVEEAYNQEKGVVQHIFTTFYGWNSRSGPDDELWNLAFTQEWPVFSQTHQFSYTIPYSFLRLNGRAENGLGDILLNYRFQAYFNPRSLTALAPRGSLVLPTGDKEALVGENTVGAQFNLPFSTAIGDRWFVHANAGLTYLPGAASAQDRDLLHYNLGASAIYALTRDLHVLVEWVGYWTQFGEPGVARDHEFSSLISPGLRTAFNFAGDSQLVVGLATPLGLTDSGPDAGVFLYVSFEHFFAREN